MGRPLSLWPRAILLVIFCFCLLAIVDRHDRIFSREGHHVASAWVLIELPILVEGPRGHKILHHVTVLELVVDEVHIRPPRGVSRGGLSAVMPGPCRYA
jgi:hypothetical protein